MKLNSARIIRLTLIGLTGAIAFDLLKEIWESIGHSYELDLHWHYTRGKAHEFVGIITSIAFGIAILMDLFGAFRSLLNRHGIFPLAWILRYRMEKELLRSKSLLDAGIISEEDFQKKVIAYQSYLK